jgi:hypothetical protein
MRAPLGARREQKGKFMKWQKSPQDLIDLFTSVMPGPPAVQRKMFGYPAGFISGNMFMGLFQNDMILRLPEVQREEFLKKDDAKISVKEPSTAPSHDGHAGML